jgi:hypothetical protein
MFPDVSAVGSRKQEMSTVVHREVRYLLSEFHGPDLTAMKIFYLIDMVYCEISIMAVLP